MFIAAVFLPLVLALLVTSAGSRGIPTIGLFARRELLMKKYLERAERHADARGDTKEFKNLYVGFRRYNNIEESVWKTLSYLYGNESANLLKYQ